MMAKCKKTHDNPRLKVRFIAGKEYEIDETSPGIGRFFDISKQSQKPEGQDDREQLLAEARALGIDAKGTWGAAKLKEAIATANK